MASDQRQLFMQHVWENRALEHQLMAPNGDPAGLVRRNGFGLTNEQVHQAFEAWKGWELAALLHAVEI